MNGADALQHSTEYPNIRVISVKQHSSTEPLYDFSQLYEPWSRPNPGKSSVLCYVRVIMFWGFLCVLQYTPDLVNI